MQILAKLPLACNAVPTVIRSEKTSLFVPQRTPEFLRVEYPTFVEFIKTFYKYREAQKDGHLNGISSIKDLDLIGKKYLEGFYKDYAKGMPVFPYMGMADFIRNSKQFYLSRGSEESYQFLFRIMFGEEIALKYPSESIFKSSYGKWKQDVSFYVDIQVGELDETAIGNTILIKSLDGTNFTTQITGVKDLGSGLVEIFIKNLTVFSFKGGDEVFYQFNSTTQDYDVKGRLINTVNKATIIKEGSGFRLGDEITITSPEGDQFVVRITAVTPSKGISKIEFLSFPKEVQSSFFRSLYSDGTSDGSFVVDSVFASSDRGTITTPDYFEEDYVLPDYCAAVLTTFGNTGATEYIDNRAMVNFELGVVNKYSGRYENSDGFLSDSNKLQDNYFYQAFSYVIQSQIQKPVYEAIVNQILHPAGTIMFGEYNVQSVHQLNIQVETLLEKTIVLSDLAHPSDSFVREIEYYRSINDSITPSDLISKTFIKEFDDDAESDDFGQVLWAIDAGDYAEDYFADPLYVAADVQITAI